MAASIVVGFVFAALMPSPGHNEQMNAETENQEDKQQRTGSDAEKRQQKDQD
jgi:hypothetical protein